MNTQTKITGLKELGRRARKLDAALQKKVYKKAVRESAKKSVLPAAKSRAPSGGTGALKKALTLRASNKAAQGLYGMKLTANGSIYRSLRTARRSGGKEYQPDWVARYYRFAELGTKFHAANPFLLPALEASQGAFFSGVRSQLRAGIEQNT